MSISKQFVLAGEAVFTIEIPPAHRPEGKEEHYTYRVQKVEANERFAEAFFAQVLTGPDNTKDFTYLGKLNPETGEVAETRKSAFSASAYRFRILNRILNRVWAADPGAFERHGFHAHHEGTCGRCGHRLTVPESIQTGIGPECCKIMGLPAVGAKDDDWLESRDGSAETIDRRFRIVRQGKRQFALYSKTAPGGTIHHGSKAACKRHAALVRSVEATRPASVVTGPAGGVLTGSGMWRTGD